MEILGKVKQIKDKFIFIFLPLVFVLYSLWALIIPFGEAPDEPLRFDIGNFIFKYHELPVLGDSRLTDFNNGISYASLPQLPYIIGGFMMFLASPFIDSEYLFIVHRFVSVFSSVATVFFAYQICKKLNLSVMLCYFVATFLAFIPQFSFESAYVNQNAFSMMAGLMTIYFWLVGHDNQWKVKNIILVGFANSLVLLTYLNGYVVLIPTIIFLLWSSRNKSENWFRVLWIYAITVFVCSGWWFIRNAYLYNGDFLGLSISTKVANSYSIIEVRPENRVTPMSTGLSIIDFYTKTNFIASSYNSFWAAFGWMDTWLNFKVYIYIQTVHALSIVGNCFLFIKLINQILKKGLTSVLNNKLVICSMLFFFIIAETFALSSYYSYVSDFQPQGRYIFPAIFQVVFFITLGFEGVFNIRFKKWFYLFILISMFALNIYSLFIIVLSKYYS